jgi:hypothetical protein
MGDSIRFVGFETSGPLHSASFVAVPVKSTRVKNRNLRVACGAALC